MADRQTWILEQFALKLAEVAGSMLGSETKAELTEAAAEPPEDALVWEQGFDVGDGCRVVVAASEASWEKIGGEALKAAGVDELDRDSVRGTYLELLSQALSGVASEIGSLLGRNISAVDGREIPAGAGQVSRVLQLVLNGEPVTLQAGVAAKLVSLLAAADESAAPVADEGSRPDAAEREEAVDGTRTLDLLLDVELPVSVSFGRASVPLKDVLKLTSGSIVELNRGVSDPVELIVNNCVIARGEVVVVEGNYGVRIQQIVSARERLRTLS